MNFAQSDLRDFSWAVSAWLLRLGLESYKLVGMVVEPYLVENVANSHAVTGMHSVLILFVLLLLP